MAVTCSVGVAAEARGGFADGGAASAFRPGVLRLAEVVDDLAGTAVDRLDDDEIRELLRGIQRSIRRLHALRARGAGELEDRAVTAAPEGHAERARQDNRRRLRDELDLTAGEAKQATETGRRLKDAPRSGQAYAAGTISDAHARVITDTLAYVPEDRQNEVETRLLDLARTQDAVSLGRSARRILAEIDLQAAEGREQRQHARRSVRISESEDGGVHLTARLYGLQAEKLRTAMDAFNPPEPRTGSGDDAPRTYQQRCADALETLLDVALQSGRAPTQHGVRPHVLVIVRYSELALQAGIAELGFTGPITMASLRPLLRDCTVSRIVLGPDSVPIEAGESVRTVPQGLWRVLVARDGGCTWAGCAAPPAWCDVAHGSVPFRDRGRLHVDDAALLCRRHHRRFDAGPWRMVIEGPSVRYERISR